MTKLAIAVMLTFVAQSGHAQTFEVASVKPSDPNGPGTMIGFPNGNAFKATGITAMNCIGVAYSILPFQLAGGPAWIGSQRYDIVAKMPADTASAPSGPARTERIRVALQALLAERFQLAVHREAKTMPAYVLVVAKTGFKLKEAADDGRGMEMSAYRGKLTFHKVSMELFARNLSGNLNSPVVDMTGIKGVFDLTLEWTPDEAQSPAKAGSEGWSRSRPRGHRYSRRFKSSLA